MKYKILDLFSGAGGFSNGLDQVKNFETLLAVDFNEWALKTISFNNPNITTILGDIKDKEIKNKIINLSKQKEINMIIGGPPCQGFSSKGKKLGLEDERNFLFLEYIDLVKEIKPQIFIIENVKNLITSSDGYFINEIKNKFLEMGYHVNFEILNSINFGVPQNRERAIIVGLLNFQFNFENLMKNENKHLNIFDAISDLQFLESGEGEFESKYLLPAKTDYQRKMRNSNNILYNHIATNHSPLAIKKLKMIPPECGKNFLPENLRGKQKFKTTWTRLEWNKPSPTIDTRFDTPSNGKNSHPFLNRSITPREAARIQSFKDDYVFLGPKTEVCKQIGNAVPPLMAKAIGEEIIKQNTFYYEKIVINNNSIYHANSEYIFNYFKKNNIKFDHIITDPPYVISQKNNFNTLKNKRTGVFFGEWDQEFDVTNWIKKYTPLIKENGSLIVFCSYRNISFIISEIEKCGFAVKDFLQWKKTNPMPRNVERRYVQDTEFAIWAVNKKGKWTFNKPKDIPYLRSIFQTSIVSGKEKTNHPTQKKLELMQSIIKIHTNKNDLILDPFMGSGTTGIAAIKENRNFIGIELNKEYFSIAKKRFQELKN